MNSNLETAIALPLSKGRFALVDIADAEVLQAYRWHAATCGGGKVYARRSSNVGTIYMHREILGLAKERGIVVDHLNGDTLNNTRTNLRACSPSANLQNSFKLRSRASAYRGVFASGDKWIARIRHLKRAYYLGRYASEELAAAAYDGAAIALYGVTAFLNFRNGNANE